ncbi:hypothetical protein ACPA9J_00095 [Pseudomonas aeruginosa]
MNKDCLLIIGGAAVHRAWTRSKPDPDRAAGPNGGSHDMEDAGA